MGSQGAHPACLFLALTLTVTVAATVLLCTAMLSNHWEVISLNRPLLEALVQKHNASHTLTWLFGGIVAKVTARETRPVRLIGDLPRWSRASRSVRGRDIMEDSNEAHNWNIERQIKLSTIHEPLSSVNESKNYINWLDYRHLGVDNKFKNTNSNEYISSVNKIIKVPSVKTLDARRNLNQNKNPKGRAAQASYHSNEADHVVKLPEADEGDGSGAMLADVNGDEDEFVPNVGEIDSIECVGRWCESRVTNIKTLNVNEENFKRQLLSPAKKLFREPSYGEFEPGGKFFTENNMVSVTYVPTSLNSLKEISKFPRRLQLFERIGRRNQLLESLYYTVDNVNKFKRSPHRPVQQRRISHTSYLNLISNRSEKWFEELNSAEETLKKLNIMPQSSIPIYFDREQDKSAVRRKLLNFKNLSSNLGDEAVVGTNHYKYAQLQTRASEIENLTRPWVQVRNDSKQSSFHRIPDDRTLPVRSNGISKLKSSERIMFLTPLHGGIWTMCVDLSEEQQNNLTAQGFGMSGCINYLDPPNASRGQRSDWIQRMQNLSISCALVCCIILASCALVGFFGILNRQISAVLVTGVMYILATIFAVFCLAIMHFKRRTKKDCANVDSQVSAFLNAARVFSYGWSLSMGWAGAVVCLGAALLWLLLARIMRYNPISLS
ncbi:uncharacterized protein LOC108671163 [Hyalella azteca]|uniref:Uncharacterized protein LOC108671163 n=1 Tax=Hyalella azteca TaxID=294128 RepID=A0A8B7NLK8_HYAAZ|nr:uncharacterized protein LOC108671163 [Hyalella azteca]